MPVRAERYGTASSHVKGAGPASWKVCPIAASLLKAARQPPTIGAGEVGWHQDFPFFPHTNFDLLACMFLLDDATPDNGCMRVIPGSHHLGPVPHEEDGRFRGHVTERRYVDDSQAVDLAIWAGSMTIHHWRTLHAS